jgi:hypothetical protein
MVVALAHLLARPFAWRGITGRLARDNTVRHPGRTAVTAAALMIGLALVSLISILAAGTKASINNAIDASFAGNLIIQNSANAGKRRHPDRDPGGAAQRPGRRAGHRDRLHGGARQPPQGQPDDHRAGPR